MALHTGRSAKPILMQLVSDAEYRSVEGYVMRREEGETPNGNPVNGRWVLRTPDLEWVDVDRYRHDLCSRYNLQIEGE